MTQAGKPAGGGKKSVLDAYPDARRKPVVMQEGAEVSPRSTMIKVVVAAVLMIVAGVGACFCSRPWVDRRQTAARCWAKMRGLSR